VRAVDELIDSIANSSEIPSATQRQEIQRELRSHIAEFVDAAREAGRDEDEIEKLVLAHFGDPRQIAHAFAWVYRHERRRFRAVAYAVSTLLLATCLAAAVLAMQAGLAFGSGRAIREVYASRHTAIEVLDILASVAVYLALISLEDLFASRRFPNAALLLTATVCVLMGACRAAGWHSGFLLYGLVAGIFFRALRLFVAPKIARAGIVLVCFTVAGVVSALAWSAASPVALAATSASWLVMGAGYLVMTEVAERIPLKEVR
jgi:hypothetical protein